MLGRLPFVACSIYDGPVDEGWGRLGDRVRERRQTNMEDLATALSRIAELLRASEDSDWATFGAQRLARVVEKQAARAQQGRAPRKWLLRYLFAPTGDVQEHSISNGWGEEFLDLADVIDRYVQKQ